MNTDIITPEGFYVYAEKQENKNAYRLHVHTGDRWVTMGVSTEAMQDPEELRSKIKGYAPGYRRNGEFPRRCAAQRAILENLIVPFNYGEFALRMGYPPTVDGWEIEPHEQLKSVEIMKEMVHEGIRKLQSVEEESPAPWSQTDSSIEFKLPILSKDWGKEHKWGPRGPLPSPEPEPTPVPCECGSGVANTTHSTWCPARGG